MFNKYLLLALLCTTSLVGCGGGGGGGSDFAGSADVGIDAEPREIDTGDHILVRTFISNVNEQGILLKFKYPTGLAYVARSAYLKVDDDSDRISPKANKSLDSFSYLVFFLKQSQFGNDNQGEITLELMGTAKVDDKEIQVDADLNNPLINDDHEFSVATPNFEAVDSVGVTVRGGK